LLGDVAAFSTPEGLPRTGRPLQTGPDRASNSNEHIAAFDGGKGAHMTDTIEGKLAALGLSLPGAPAPVANYVPTCQTGGLLFVSGQVSRRADGQIIKGKLGGDLDVDAGREAAKVCALNILAQARAALGSLDRIERVVKLTGFVNSAPDFANQPQVVNGASDLLVDLLGDKGRHTRSAVGVAALPSNAAVEVEAILAVRAD
jgi:enamine deaminase RidA (YjgF/YER057c/UK114 family)